MGLDRISSSLRHSSLLAGLVPVLAFGQQAEQATTTSSTDLSGSFVQLGFGFVIVLALLFASLWLLKRLTSPGGQAGGLMKIVSSLTVGPRERVILMEVGDQWLLVGVGPGHITKLGELPKQALPATPNSPSTSDFSVWLKKAIERRPGQGS